MRLLLWSGLVASVVAVLAILGAQGPDQRHTAAQASVTIGIDVDPTQSPANTATSLGSIESCISVTAGQPFAIDLYITDVEDFLAWETYLTYDPAVVNVMAIDVQMFQATNPDSDVFNASQDTPDQDGRYYAAAADMGTVDSGSGVLARITLLAVGPGISNLDMTQTILKDSDNDFIGDTNGDGYFDGPIANGEVRVGELCPGQTPSPTVTPTPTATPTPSPTPTATPTPVVATLGIDADPSQSPANTATSLGSIESCVSVTIDQSFAIDLYITDIENLRGWSAVFFYDGAVVNVSAVDVQMFQAANPDSNVLSLSDATPDSDGSFFVGAFDFGSVDSGSGVLVRITLLAVGPGLSPANLAYPELKDDNSIPIGDTNGDGYFDGSVFNAQIAVDEPGAEGPIYGDACGPDTDGDGFSDDLELYIQTNPSDACADTPAVDDEPDDKWPLDMNDDQTVNTGDVLSYAGLVAPPTSVAPGRQRLDLDANGTINTSDLLHYAGMASPPTTCT